MGLPMLFRTSIANSKVLNRTKAKGMNPRNAVFNNLRKAHFDAVQSSERSSMQQLCQAISAGGVHLRRFKVKIPKIRVLHQNLTLFAAEDLP